MDVAFRSEQGSPRRQEDYCLSLPEQGIFLVCDGLSVKDGGDLAARLLADSLVAWAQEEKALIERARTSSAKEGRRAVEDSLAATFQRASAGILQQAAAEASLHGMCAGADFVLLLGHHALVAHVGAGRVYLVRKGEAHLLTEDHTQLAYLRRIGKLDTASPQQISSFSRRLTRAVGFQAEVKVDFLQVEMEPGDRFVLMSDGIWQALGEETTFSFAAAAGAPAEMLRRIHQTVGENNPRDNFTTLVLDPQLQAVPVAAGAEQKIKMLGKVPAFEYLSYTELLKVLSVSDLVKVSSGNALCKEGDEGGEMMLILSGAVDVSKSGQVIRRLGRGEVFGEMSMIDAAPRSASVTAAGATNVLAFPRDALFTLFREDSDLAVKFLWGVVAEMNKRLRGASNRLVGKPESDGAPLGGDGPLPFHRSV